MSCRMPGHSLLSANAWLSLGSSLGLSARELQIVQGVFGDQKEEAIAADMGISPHTVNTYFQRLYRKLNVRSRPQLIVRVMAHYLRAISSEPFSSIEVASQVSCAQATDEYASW